MRLRKIINQFNIKKYELLTKEINLFYEKLSTQQNLHINQELLKIKNSNLSDRKKITQAIAYAKYAAKKILGMTYYDVQIMGALGLIDGCMVEMKTGEGKTLTCSAAVVANYVLGYTTHVATANDYLAQRDHETLNQLYFYLGLKSNYNISILSKEEKRKSYSSDVVYSTAQEFGFDFLKDNLIYNLSDKIMPLYFNKTKCIIDEADFILIDEARTPLVISGDSPIQNETIYHIIESFIFQLKKMDKEPNPKFIEDIPGDYWLDYQNKMAYLSESGYALLEKFTLNNNLLKPNKHNKLNLYDDINSWIIHDCLNALKAYFLYINDKDYVLLNNKVVIVDQNTGRLSHNTTWSNGLHQSIEMKEKLIINPENMTIGTISIQNYFKIYCQISGMSGTIMDSSEEFEQIYNCKTLQIDTNKPMIRINHQDKIYLNINAKYNELIKDINERHNKGQPLLIGTSSVVESEIISELLNKKNIKHHVLNAKNNSLEAQIIAQAGQPYSVTVATSMAGRGTDIILGGNKEILTNILNSQLEQIKILITQCTVLIKEIHHIDDLPIPEKNKTNNNNFENSKNQKIIDSLNIDNLHQLIENDYLSVWTTLINLQQDIIQQKENLHISWKKWKDDVINSGGLCVIGSSRNESRRIDDQLRGRSGRQGDPGESIFYLSTQDSWVSIFGKNPIFTHLAKTMPTDQLISAPVISRLFAKIQRQIEGLHFENRKHTYQYDSVADEGRKNFLFLRNSLLFNNHKTKEILENKLLETLYFIIIEEFLFNYEQKNRLISDSNNTLIQLLKLPINIILKEVTDFLDDYPYEKFHPTKHERLPLLESYIANLLKPIEENMWNELNNSILIYLDQIWSEHLNFIEEAQNNVSFSSIIQKNPLYEYKKICFDSYASMIKNLKNKIQEEFIIICSKN